MAQPNAAGRARAQAEENRLTAFELHKAGATFRQIARTFGVSVSTAHGYITTVLARLTKEQRDVAARYRALQLARLQDLVFAIWPKAMAGDPQAATALLRIMEREAKLLNLDGPDKVDFEPRIRAMAIREGLDPDEAVREAYRVIKEYREET